MVFSYLKMILAPKKWHLKKVADRLVTDILPTTFFAKDACAKKDYKKVRLVSGFLW